MSSRRNDQGKGGIFGQGLPGTGGDLRRDDDVEGHGARRDDEAEGLRRDDDTEGLRRDDDTEGHLYTGGPTTQGEFARRAPSENPHGER